jgi:NitT/TauT family transport system substrate-binding protein
MTARHSHRGSSRPGWRSIVLTLVAVALLAAACGGESAETTTTAAGTTTTGGGSTVLAPETLSFIFPNEGNPEIIFYPFWVAEDLGFFAAENLTVNAIGSDGSSAATQQMIAGQADAGTPFSAPVIEAASQGYDMRYIYTYSTAKNFGIMVPEASPAQSVADLKGKVIGISAADGGEVAVIRAAFVNLGLNPDTDVTLLAVGEGSPATLAAIENGDVDAYSSSFGDFLTLAAAGLKLRDITPAEFDNFPAHGISTTTQVLDTKRDALVRLGRAYAKATLFCQTSPEACKTIMMRLSPAQWEDPVLGDATLTRQLEITAVPEGMRIGEHQRASWDRYNQFRVETDPAAKLADLDTFLVYDLLDDINNFDHQAIIDLATNSSE